MQGTTPVDPEDLQSKEYEQLQGQKSKAFIEYIKLWFKSFFSVSVHVPEFELSSHELPWYLRIRKAIAFTIERMLFHVLIITLLLIDIAIVVVSISLHYEHMNDHDNHTLAMALKILEYASVTILCLFLVESFIRLIAFGLRVFMNFWYMLDFVVVVLSLFVELFAGSIYSIIVFARIWRVVRIILTVTFTIGAALSAKNHSHKQKIQKLREAYEKRLKELQEQSETCLAEMESKFPESSPIVDRLRELLMEALQSQSPDHHTEEEEEKTAKPSL
jgi:sensor histidine kinase YesM